METQISSSFLQTIPHLQRVPSASTVVPPKSMIITAKSTFHHSINNKKSQNPIQIRKKIKSLLATIFNKIDDFICDHMDLPLRPSIDPEHVLSENFAPVAELPPTACEVAEGSLPPCLDGAYIRNGPNPYFTPKGPYHLLDGDGMLHMIRIQQGEATFCCRYVDTHKHAVEREIGYPVVPNFFAAFNGVPATISRCLLTAARILTGQFDPVNHGFGTANTSVALIAGHLLALCESDLPYAIKITAEGDIITLGRHNFQASGPFFRMTAHPKIDHATGEAFAFCYNIMSPFLTLFRISSQGKKQDEVAIHTMRGLTAMHDFAVTENYCVIPDVQIVVNPLWALKGRSPVGVDATKVPRLGIIRKNEGREMEEKEMRWIDVAGLNMLHCVNAWEEDEGETINIVGSNIVAVNQVFERFDQAQLTLEKITIDVTTNKVQRHRLCDKNVDFGVINPAYAAMRNRYVYAVVIGTKALLGVVKLDLSLSNEDGRDCTVASRLHGPGCYGSEPYFVARDPNNPITDEDDGYLVTYVHDSNIQASKFIVMDAKSPTLDIIATVKLPQRVPNGFHGLFVPESDLNKLWC